MKGNQTNRLAPLRPILKWAGGKRWLATHVAHLYEPYRDRRLVEPFCGGLSIALHLRPRRALLADINPHLINFYRQVQLGLKIDEFPRTTERAFYESRDEFNKIVKAGGQDTPEAAVLFYYLNRTCYNGLCRFNKGGGFNVPYGFYKRPQLQKTFDEYRKAFAQWEFRACSFRDLLPEGNDFLYVDPPYHVTFSQYSKEGFSWRDQRAVAERYAAHPGPVVLSNSKTAHISRLYRKNGYSLVDRHGPRMISCDGDRTRAKEVVGTLNILPGPVLGASALPTPRLGDVLPA